MGERFSNIASQLQFELGDAEAAFAEADVIVEGEFETAAAHQGYIEPQNGTAQWNADGTLTVWVSTQGPFVARATLSKMLDIPLSQVKVVPMEIGGGFGGKLPAYMEPLAALMSRMTGRPVKMYMNREEVLIGTGPTSSTYVRARLGAKADGTLIAADATLAYEAGAYPGSPVGAGATCMLSSYDIPNLYVNALDVVTNKPKCQAYRAPGSPQGTFAVESLMDDLAERLGRDPMDLRAQNAASEGSRRADGVVMPLIGATETMQAAIDSPHYRSELQGHGRRARRFDGLLDQRGHGVGGVRVVELRRLGQTCRSAPSTSAGSEPALAMQFAETMGIDLRAGPAAGRRHRLDRLHARHRWQPRDLCDGYRGPRGRARRAAPDGAARRADLGHRRGEHHV